MMTRCPTSSELLLYALQLRDDRQPRDIGHHVSRCASCRATVMHIREVAGVLQSSSEYTAETANCLDEMTVANVVEHGVDVVERTEIIAHLAACAHCREQVAAVATLLRNTAVAAEIARIEMSTPVSAARRWRFAGAGALTAIAAAALFMVMPSGERTGVTQPVVGDTDGATHREQSVTTTAAPILIVPVGVLAAADTFRWTSVPNADRYRVTLFDKEGRWVWEAEGPDTAMVKPATIAGNRGAVFLWKVEARTGWDRWVSSELIEFSITSPGRIP